MRKNLILAAVLVVLLALPAALYAQETDPEIVANGFVAAVNEGDAEAATALLDENVTADAPQGTSGEAGQEGTDPAAQEQHVGKAEVEAWIEGQMSAGGNTELGECVVEGEVATCDAKFTSDALAAMGVAEIEGEVMIRVNAEGKIQNFAFTPTAESAAALSAAGAEAAVAEAPATMPVTGGGSLPPNALILALGGLLAAGGLGLQRIGRREN